MKQEYLIFTTLNSPVIITIIIVTILFQVSDWINECKNNEIILILMLKLKLLFYHICLYNMFNDHQNVYLRLLSILKTHILIWELGIIYYKNCVYKWFINIANILVYQVSKNNQRFSESWLSKEDCFLFSYVVMLYFVVMSMM